MYVVSERLEQNVTSQVRTLVDTIIWRVTVLECNAANLFFSSAADDAIDEKLHIGLELIWMTSFDPDCCDNQMTNELKKQFQNLICLDNSQRGLVEG